MGEGRRCVHCGNPLPPGKRRDARYCDSSCRADATLARQKATGEARKALRSAARTRRRPTRDGSGTRIYITPEEADRWGDGVLPGSVREKLDAAAEKLGRAA